IIHEHCGESGAIGAGLEAARLYENGRRTTFIGLEAVQTIAYTATTSEDTRCHFCKNDCLRTFIDVEASRVIKRDQGEVDTASATAGARKSKVPLAPGARRLIVNNSCEKGLVEDVESMREIKKDLDARLKAAPNFVEKSARDVFKSYKPEPVADPTPKHAFTAGQKARVAQMKKRESYRIGIPRMLNQYSTNPLFSAYFESLGLRAHNLVYSDYTNEELYKEGAKRGSIDPCFPSKLGIPHVHNLIFKQHEKKPLDAIFFPMIDDLKSELKKIQDCRACPTVTATPEAVKAAFTKEGDLFAKKGIRYMCPVVNVAQPHLFARQMFAAFKDILGLSEKENERAVEAGFKALDEFVDGTRREARAVLDELERENKIGIVVLGRPYHNDPGINHEILVEFQKLGYPVFTQDSLPIDDDILDRLFGDEVRAGDIEHPMDISDVWKNAYSENTSRKVWAAKYTARHPNLVALEVSNFKCGHDAPIYSVVEEIIESSGTPYYSFKDLDENRPAGSIKIRVETIGYFLKRYREDKLRDEWRDRVIDHEAHDATHVPLVAPLEAPAEDRMVEVA
ncbi:MAG TPA: acyl-CoA dehydratase activase-related protein, partial [Candidatus Krumholzibacteria bacterium]|nr:acyl-CoA dehydratase activase-related protein [Candidatus Krumholzibacteria bacterium]